MKKSKFLKKSLAMLLALMLVVAMIPLSASAASSEGPSLIYVDDNTVALPEAEVDVPTGTKTVQMRLNSSLGSNYELRVLAAADTQLNDIVLVDTKDPAKNTVALADYMDSNNKIHLQLYKRVGNSNNWETVEGCAYTVTVNFTALSTTTDVKFVANVKGVYSATVDTENKIVNVVLARHTGTVTPSETNTWNETMQKTGAFQMVVAPVDGEDIDGTSTEGGVIVDADNGDTFTVTSESGNNVATYTVKVTSYLEALSEFTVTGTDGEKYSATPVDANLDDVPDTIVVNLPESAIYDKTTDSSFPNPQLAVSYVAEGDVTSNVVVKKDTGDTTGTAVKSDGSVKVTFTGLGTAEEYEGTVTATRLTDKNGAVQTYDLLVQLEKDTSTEITYVKVNSTLGEVDAEAGTLTASVPTVDNIATKKATVTLKTPATVQSVTLNSVKMTKATSVDAGVATWTFTGVDVSKQQIVDVVAEDGVTKQTYTLNVTTDTNTTDATITAIWIKNKLTGETYHADVTTSEDDLLVKVPFMTTDIRDWTIFVTPSSHAYVTYGKKNTQVVNGETTLSAINGKLGPIDADKTWEIEVTANNKNNAAIKKNYTLTIDLESPKDGKTLADLDFSATAQTTDKLIALKSVKDVNTFDAQIDTHTNGSTNVTNLNLEVPVSLTDDNDLGLDYSNVVTNFATNNGGVAYYVTEENSTGYWLTSLKAIGTSTTAITGTKLNSGDKIVVMNEKAARAFENGETASTEYILFTTDKDIIDSSTVYQVNIEVAKGDNKSQLKTFKVGDTTLKVEGDKITGELPFSLTSETKTGAKAMFAEFTMDDYARLFAFDAGKDGVKHKVGLFSNGDINDDGIVDDIDTNNNTTASGTDYAGFNNYKLVFVRQKDAKQPVKVYRYQDKDNEFVELTGVQVQAENRLDYSTNGGKLSSSTYKFDLTWAAPCEEADIETFTLGGYTGVINNDVDEGRTIKVTVPYGTDVTGLVAEFTASSGATVKLGSTTGLDFVSGVTSANYSNPVQLWITSEDGDTTRMYTVTVEEGISFSDVNPGDWFYDNVMDAAENGYISGMGDGTFNPTGATTRAQFASMIANAMGYEANPDAKSAFPDVADDFWGKAAINFCVENGILSGYDDGTFQPNKAITRQEAASILRNAFELTETTDELFPDDSAIAGWAKESVYLVKASGLMKGDAGTGNFRPTSTITRAEAASILMNAKYAGVID